MTDQEDEHFSARKTFPHLAEQFALMDRVSDVMWRMIGGVREIETQDIDKSRYQFTVLHLFSKALKTHRAIEHLLEGGFPEDAILLLRAQMELVITLSYIAMDPDNLARRHMDYSYVTRWRLLQAVLNEGLHEAESDVEAQRELEENYNCYLKEYGKGESWSGITICEMAEKAGLGKEYRLFYRRHSQYVHSSSHTANQYLKPHEQGDGFSISLHPDSSEYYVEIMMDSCKYCLDLATKFTQVFEPGLDAEIDGLLKDWFVVFTGADKTS